MAKVGFVACSLASIGALATVVVLGQDPRSSDLTLDLAAPYAAVVISGHDGRVVASAGSDRVRVQVTLSRGCDPDAFALRSTGDTDRLELRVEPSTKDRCDEKWSVNLPAATRLEASMDRADVQVKDVASGVDLHVGNGTLVIDVAGGDVRARVEKGDIVATHRAPEPGPVQLQTTVGRVRLELFGAPLQHRRAPGAGDRITLDGRGSDHISLRSTVGDVRLVLER